MSKISKKQLKDAALEPHQDEKPNRLLPISRFEVKQKSFHLASSYPKQKTSHGLFTV
ncbi:hypothetical protein NC651_035203 [Populus alba x Populus x berolinensis]|nr:hypothetical protein NC651_035203 [Populus alba x Populus x berolinensis]